MFTGIVEAKGYIERVKRQGTDLSLSIDTGELDLRDVKLGDSIAVNGVCLTAVSLLKRGFVADVSAESLIHTNIASFSVGTAVNLEKALTLAARIGGHLVSGHVDGIGTIVDIINDGRSVRFEVACANEIEKYIAAKGSISVDGVSLTVTTIKPGGFCLNIVPHTMGNTILPEYKKGALVHLEVDLIARYTERLLNAEGGQNKGNNSAMSEEFLSRHGFMGRR